MFPVGARLLIGGTLAAAMTAIIYGATVWGSLGTTGLIFVAVTFAFLTGIVLAVRDGDVKASDPRGTADAPAARPAPSPSLWPVIGALGAALLVVGAVTYPVVFIFGIFAVLAATVEWMVTAWSERASSERHFNAGVRSRMANPAEFPVLAAVGAGIVIFSFSRIMLFLSKAGGVVAFALIASAALAFGFIIALRPQLRGSVVAGVAALAVLGLAAGGAATGLSGEREIHEHESTGTLAAEGGCDTAEHTHADDRASQTVGAQANVHGELVLRQDGTLVARTIGVEGDRDSISLWRATPTNILFVNESPDDRRLVLDLGVRPVLDEDGNEVEDESVPEQICTALVENGGSQLLTFAIGVSSSEDNPYRFFVPGTDEEVEVIVP